MSTSVASETREQKIAQMIKASRAEFQLEPLDNNRLAAALEQWMERLRAIPTSWLRRCYEVAMETHTKREALIPQELLTAWGHIQNEVAIASVDDVREVFKEKLCPFWCSEAGIITVDNQGNRPASNYNGYTYAKACPIHRPNGISRDKRCAPWNGTTRKHVKNP